MRIALPLAAPLCLFPTIAAAQAPGDVADLVGARASGGETQLLSRGYEARQSNVVRDQRFTFWWNPRLNRCISVSTSDGRYAAIIPVPAENCGSGSSHASRPAVDHDDRVPEPRYRDPNALVLVCYGAGTRPTVTSKPTYSWNPWTHKWEWSSQVGNSAQGFNSDVQIELFGNAGRIHLGSKMVPPIHSGGDNSWWDLDNLVVTRDRITATYRLNGMNKPKLSVDRRTGQITIAAQTNFSGQCDLGDWGAGTRRF